MAAHPITLDPDLQERIERAAEREVRSPESLLRDAVELYFKVYGETNEGEARTAEHDVIWKVYAGPTITRAQFLKEADESLEHYLRTGLHVTNEEVGEWIERLRDDPHAKRPECHT